MIGPALVGHGRRRSGSDRRANDRAGRHAEQVAAGSERDPGCFAGYAPRAAALAKRSAALSQHLRAACLSRRTRRGMPLPMVNMISGGKHAGGNLDFQDVLIMPGRRAGLSDAAGMDRPRLSAAGKAADGGGLRRLPGRRRRGLWPAAEVEPRGGRVRRAGDRGGRTCGRART